MYQKFKEAARRQLPSIAGLNFINMGAAYFVDYDLTGEARFFKKIAGDVTLLAPDLTYLVDSDVPAGRNAVMFRDFQPGVGDILEYNQTQHVVSSWADGITNLTPQISADAPEGSVFRRLAVPVEIKSQVTARSLDIASEWTLIVGDTLQIGTKTYRVTVAQLDPTSGRWDVAVDQDITTFSFGNTTGYLICNPAYISDPIDMTGKDLGPFDLAFPIATQFERDFDFTVNVDLLASSAAYKSYTLVSKTTNALRFPMYEMTVNSTNLVCAERVMGKLDFDGSGLGMFNRSIIRWVEDFPSDQIKRWTIRYKSRRSGKLVVTVGDQNAPQVVAIEATTNGTVSVNGPAAQTNPSNMLQIAFLSDSDSDDDIVWIRDILPDVSVGQIRYSMLFESTNLYRSEHLLVCGPRAEPSLPNISFCASDPQAIDSGWLLRNEI